jgi:hypothetical protein
MKKTLRCAVLLSVLAAQISLPHYGQTDFTWYNPVEQRMAVIEGQQWAEEVTNPFQRLPDRAQGQVRSEVWNLSQHAAGLMVRFKTEATEIVVRYQVSGNLAMPHMPATGVSGVDLYARDNAGNWKWCRGNRSFEDTISYQFTGLQTASDASNYYLYLPLYNQVKWLEIGIKGDTELEFLPKRQKPIVIYGTSIAQGACASRPGMAWSNILSRKLDYPIINLAFSGNGRLEEELIGFIAEINASIFVLDCLPNLTNAEQYDHQELNKRINHAVMELRSKHPQTPIVLTEHAGYTDGLIQTSRQQTFERVNRIQKETYQQLLQEGFQNVYYLTYQELGLQLDDMVDGTHPNDLGMMRYAEAYEQKIREILFD